MEKVESVLNGSLGWGKARILNTFPQILFGLLSLILPKIFIIKRGEGGASASHPRVETLSRRLVHFNLTLPSIYQGGFYDAFVAVLKKEPAYIPPSDIDGYIQDLPDTCFKNNANQRKNALHNKLMEVQDFIDADYYQEAIDKLIHDIRGKVDGTGNNGWIICSYAQEELTAMIDSLIEYLEGLL